MAAIDDVRASALNRPSNDRLIQAARTLQPASPVRVENPVIFEAEPHGDYTHDRNQWLSGLTIEQIEEEIRRMKARGEI